jgi:5-methylcytosine-specific restriction endonuclease McrA
MAQVLVVGVSGPMNIERIASLTITRRPPQGIRRNSKAYSRALIRPSKHITPEVKVEVFHRDGGRCVACGRPSGVQPGFGYPIWGDLTFDHIFPWSHGGSNNAGNIQLMCRSCNSSKGNRLDHPFSLDHEPIPGEPRPRKRRKRIYTNYGQELAA